MWLSAIYDEWFSAMSSFNFLHLFTCDIKLCCQLNEQFKIVNLLFFLKQLELVSWLSRLDLYLLSTKTATLRIAALSLITINIMFHI
jgi:hypothetical protein